LGRVGDQEEDALRSHETTKSTSTHTIRFTNEGARNVGIFIDAVRSDAYMRGDPPDKDVTPPFFASLLNRIRNVVMG